MHLRSWLIRIGFVLSVSLPVLPDAARADSALCRAAIATAEAEAGLPATLLLAIGRVESGRRDPASGRAEPWPWTINAEGRGSFYPSREAAVAAVRALQAAGVRSIDVGCMQVNMRHHPDAFASLEEAFEPLANARYAARFLASLKARAGDWETAAGHYHSQTPALAESYRARVTAALEAERRAPSPPPQAVAQRMPRPPAGPGAIAGGALLLSNGAERAAIVAAPSGTAGRGLDAYRSAPIALAARLPTAAAQPAPGGIASRRLF
jgi:hypothetical protein